ncbi:hypothetical protein K502DRAFT_365457 [Neoconidiobolus thromboides FSU 785]|nr:hypothetical protein K502DRAFT_365457 [Neoconidiobolus thromboides FSU 785]
MKLELLFSLLAISILANGSPVATNSEEIKSQGEANQINTQIETKVQKSIAEEFFERKLHEASGYNDPCIKINDVTKVYSYEEILDCYDSFPFNSKIRDEVLDSMWKFMPFYVFADVSRKRSVDASVEGRTLDIESALATLRIKNYTTDRGFQTDVMDLFTELKDGHTTYSPTCYSKFSFKLPFPLVVVEDNNKLIVKVRSGYQHNNNEYEAWKSKGIDIKAFDDAIVEKIDGRDAITAIEQVADSTYGTSRDIHARMNGVLSADILADGKWNFELGMFSQRPYPPSKESVAYEMNVKGKKEVIEIPFIAVPKNEGYIDGTDFYHKYCLADQKVEAQPQDPVEIIKQFFGTVPKETILKGVEKGPEAIIEEINKEELEKSDPLVVIKKLQSTLNKTIPLDVNQDEKKAFLLPTSKLNKPAKNGIYSQFHIFGKDVGVAVLPTFAPEDTNKFIEEIVLGFKMFEQQGVKKLILDVSNNGGGIICLGYNIIKYLLPASKYSQFLLDMHVHPLLTTMLLTEENPNSFFYLPKLLKEDKTPYKNVFEFLPKEDDRTDVENRYTNFFTDQCDDGDFMAGLKKDQEHAPFALENIAIVSNSICYSTCSLFVNSLQELSNTTAFTVGGTKMRSGRKPTPGSLSGGTLVQQDVIFESLKSANLLDHPLAPKPLPVKATFSLTARQAYSHVLDEENKPVPLEFKAIQSDKHIYHTDATIGKPDLIWNKVAKEMKFV